MLASACFHFMLSFLSFSGMQWVNVITVPLEWHRQRTCPRFSAYDQDLLCSLPVFLRSPVLHPILHLSGE